MAVMQTTNRIRRPAKPALGPQTPLTASPANHVPTLQQPSSSSAEDQSTTTTTTTTAWSPTHILGIEIWLFLMPTLIAFRLANAFLVRTTFVPDEVWQSVEVAHRWVYGYGGLTWEWNSTVAIRSPLYPLLFAGMFKFLAVFGWDSREVIVMLPRLFHGFLAGVTDFTVYKMALKLSGQTSAKWVLVAQLTNWFTAYCAPRSLSNCLEWTLHALALRTYPWPMSLGVGSGSPVAFLVYVCICVILRPTAAVLWLPVCLHYFYRLWRDSSSHFWPTFCRGILIGLSCLGLSISVDRLVYGHWTVNQINFIRFNILSNGADFYGVEAWHWYFTNGLPLTLLCHLPLALIGWFFDAMTEPTGIHWLMHYRDPSRPPLLRRERAIARIFGFWILWDVLAYSCFGHKEFRFVFPMFPLFMYYAGRGLLHLTYALGKADKHDFNFNFVCSPVQLITAFLILTNALLAGYMCVVHQRGPNELMAAFARQTAAAATRDGVVGNSSFLLLMPCHTTPYLSYIHRNVTMRMLSCDPDLSTWHNTDPGAYIDEAEVFYNDPVFWLNVNYPANATPPYVAMFSDLVSNRRYGQQMIKWLQLNAYHLCGSIFHTHITSHPRHSQRIFVWCSQNWKLL